MNSTSGFFNLILPSKPVYLNEFIVSLCRPISNINSSLGSRMKSLHLPRFRDGVMSTFDNNFEGRVFIRIEHMEF